MFVFDDKRKIYYSTKIPSCFANGFGTKLTTADTLLGKNSIVKLNQTHGDRIVNYPDYNDLDGDALITNKSKVALIIRTADCVPIIFVDKKKKIVAISHQGWRGTLLKLPAKVVAAMVSMGSNQKDIVAAIGPSIGACCYDIEPDRVDNFRKLFPHLKDVFESRNGTIYLNLGYLNYLILVDAGISRDNLDFFLFCTKCNSEKFYSYRRGDSSSEMVSFVIKYEKNR